MIGEAGHICFKTLARGEHFVFATRHGGQGFRSIFSDRLPGNGKLLDKIKGGIPFVTIGAAENIQLLRSIRGERERIHKSIRDADQLHNVVKLGKQAAMVGVSLINNSTRCRPSGRRASKRAE